MLKALLGFMSCVSGYAATPTFTKASCFNGPQPHHLFGSSWFDKADIWTPPQKFRVVGNFDMLWLQQ